MEPLLTVGEVSRLLRLKPATIRQMAREGRLPSIRIARHIRFTPQAIRAIMEQSPTKNHLEGALANDNIPDRV